MAYLTQHPNKFNVEGIPLKYFAAMPWDDYLEAMARNNVYGHHIMMEAAADTLNIEIFVFSSIGPDATMVISTLQRG